jgi:hypothetical protein
MSNHWNYRVVRTYDPTTAESSLGIHEVHYEDGRVVSWTENPVPMITFGEETHTSLDELREMLERISEAMEKPVLDEDELEFRIHE